MIKTFTEYEDRYETELNINSESVVISIDKDHVSDSTEKLAIYVINNVKEILNNASKYFKENKESNNVNYIDDLSDTQIILNPDSYSIYWYSEKGENNGEAIIGIEYMWPKNVTNGLTIGD